MSENESKTADDTTATANPKLDAQRIATLRAQQAKLSQDALHRKIEVRDRQFVQDVKDANDFRAGYFEFTDEVRASSVDFLLSQLRRFTRLFPGKPIEIELFSPGGSIIDGFRLYDELERIKFNGGHHLTIRVRGQAASMAVPVLQAGDVREVGESAWLMIHRAGFGVSGKAYEVEDQAEFVRRIEDRIARIIAKRSGQPIEYFVELFKKRKDIWFDAEEALELGLVDRIG